MSPASGTYDYRILALPLMFAIATAAAALEIAGRVAAHRGRAALKWLWAGAIAMGSGLFAMHLTGCSPGGTLHFETEEEERGTTFIIRLPYDGKALAAKAVAA